MKYLEKYRKRNELDYYDTIMEEKIVFAVIEEISNRKGIGDELQQIEDNEM